MLDIILIQHSKSGLSLLEYEQENTKFQIEHSDIFSGFLNAIQSITKELNIGTVVLISTEGNRGHNCIIIPRPPIHVILLVDQEDPIDLWREQGHEIALKFIEKYGPEINTFDMLKFKEFRATIKEMCMNHKYCT